LVFKGGAGASTACYSSGFIVNLVRDDTGVLLLGGLLFDPVCRLSLGAAVSGLGKLASIVLGDYAIGSLMDPVGNNILNLACRIEAQYRWVIEAAAPGIIDRESVYEPLQTGILSIDSMVPLGRGQRELIVGDRQTGKSSIGVDCILNQKYEKVLCVYVGIGQKASTILEVFLALVRRDASFYLAMLIATGSSSAVLQYINAYTGASLSEFFMFVREIPVFLMLDDLSSHAMAYREIYLLLRRPAGREAYPGEIFFVHSRLLERSAKLSHQLGGGSVSAFPVVQTLASDVSAYITTNVISITDGQIFLSCDLFLSGFKPAVDVGLSVTRVGSAAQWDGMKLVSSSYKLELAQYVELQSFSQFSSDLGAETTARLNRGRRLFEMLKQFNGSPINLSSQIGILSVANADCITELAIESVRPFIASYLVVPSWVLLLVPVRLTAVTVVSSICC